MLFLLPLLSVSASAQQYDTLNIKRIELDSFVVRSGFDTRAFIRRVQNDTTFYKAFKSMRLVPCKAITSFLAFDRKGKVIAAMDTRSEQKIDARHCTYTTFSHKNASGDFYNKNNELNYYTAELFYNLFFFDKPVCNQDDVVGSKIELNGKSRMEKSKYELKQLMFNPGSKVSGVPFMGDKASVFDADEVDKYNFRVTMDSYDGEEVYVFEITPKEEYKNKVVFSQLKTWFRRKDYSILARDYALAYSTLFYDFDVRMSVRMRQMNGKLYPIFISYDGDWHVALKSRERMKVTMNVSY